MRRTALALVALVAAAAPAAAQQYWLPNGPGGTTYNNPNGSLLGTMNEHLLQRHMTQQQMQGGQMGGAPRQAAAPSIGSADPTFRLNNVGGRVVREVYVSSSQDSSWGADRLGANVLQPGQRMLVQLPMGQCVNDIRVVFMDGAAQEQRAVDTCALTDFSVQ